MSSADKANQKPIAAFVGIDWADQKHDIALRAASSEALLERSRIESQPEALNDWVLELRERFASQGKILICLEQSRGALIHFLMGYDCFELYPINPKQLDNYRKAFRPSGAKDDPLDAELLCQFLSLHHHQLHLWRPDDEQTRKLALFCEKRRQAVDARTALSNQLKSELKQYFPLALAVLDNDLTTVLAADFLLKWPNFESLKKAPAIAQLFAQHPDSVLFDNLPGAGDQLAPRLLSAFGSDRDRFQSPLEAVTFFGVAPVTERSGKSTWIHFRWACPKFLRQSFHEFAGHSVRFCDWAAAFYDQQRARGKGHHAAVRALAYKWIRVLFRCWKTRQPYDPQLYLAALRQRGSPLAAVNNSPQKS